MSTLPTTLRRMIAVVTLASAITVGAAGAAQARPVVDDGPRYVATGTDHIPSFRITGAARVTTVWGPR